VGERIDENSTIPAKVVHPIAHVIGSCWSEADGFKASNSIRAMSLARLPRMVSVEAPNVPRRLATESPASAPPTPARVIRARDSSMFGLVCWGGIGDGGDDVTAATGFSGVIILTTV